jgi:hypothetical protein
MMENAVDLESLLAHRDALRAVMSAYFASKPPALVQAQMDSMANLHEQVLAQAQATEEVALDLECGMLLSVFHGETRLLYSQATADHTIQKRFAYYRHLLPPSLLVQQWPLERVGALATFSLSAFTGWAAEPSDEFVAMSVGVLRLPSWGIVFGRSLGAASFMRSQCELDSHPLSWWKASLAALAADLHGWNHDSRRGRLVAAWAELLECDENVRAGLTIALEGFLFFHEIAHCELHRIQVRSIFEAGLPLHPQLCYQMEYEADAFALEHLVRVLGHRELVSEYVVLLFALFALEPSLLQRYPDCSDAETHPHPLTRLAWLARKLHPGDRAGQARAMGMAADIVMSAVCEFGIPYLGENMSTADFRDIMVMAMQSKRSPEDCRPRHNEVLETATKRRRALIRESVDEVREPKRPE